MAYEEELDPYYGVPRITVRPEAPPLNDLPWGKPAEEGGRPMGRLFEPDLSAADQPAIDPINFRNRYTTTIQEPGQPDRDQFTLPAARAHRDSYGTRYTLGGLAAGDYNLPEPPKPWDPDRPRPGLASTQPPAETPFQYATRPITAPLRAAGHLISGLTTPPQPPQRPVTHGLPSTDVSRSEDVEYAKAAQKFGVDTALNVAGVSTPFAMARPGQFAGIFGSKLSATPEQINRLPQAQQMLKEGRDLSDVWKQTGWTFDKAGTPLHEISDQHAYFRGIPDKAGQPLVLEDVLHHPELYSRFPPQLRKMPVYVDPKLDSYGSYMRGNLAKGDLGFIMLGEKALTDFNKRGEVFSTLLHEVTHPIQFLENMPKGGNPRAKQLPGSPADQLYQQAVAAVQKPEFSIEQWADKFGKPVNDPIVTASYRNYVEDHVRNVNTPEFKAALREWAGNQNYDRGVGEIYAELAPTRQDYTDLRRAEIPPHIQERGVGSDKIIPRELQTVEYYTPEQRGLAGVPPPTREQLGFPPRQPGPLYTEPEQLGLFRQKGGTPQMGSILNPVPEEMRYRGYHGSPTGGLSTISAMPTTRQFDNATSQFGAFFSPNAKEAERYAGKSGKVYSADVDLKNPYEMPISEFLRYQAPNKGPRGESLPPEKWAVRAEELKQEAAAHRDELIKSGHDGVIIKRRDGSIMEMSSFSDVPVSQAEAQMRLKGGIVQAPPVLRGRAAEEAWQTYNREQKIATTSHPFGGGGVPIRDMPAPIYSGEAPKAGSTLPRIDIEKDIPKNVEFIFTPGDAAAAAKGKLIGYEGTKFETPVAQHGGPGYSENVANRPVPGHPGAQNLWASTRGPMAAILNRAKEVASRGKEPWLAYMTGGKQYLDQATQMVQTAVQATRATGYSKPMNDYLVKVMHSDKIVPADKDFLFPATGLNDLSKVKLWLDNSPMPQHAKLVKAMDTEEARKLGFPNIAALRVMNTDARLLTSPPGSAGMVVSRINPDIGLVASHHPDYGVAVAGDKLGTLGASYPPEIIAPTMHANRAETVRPLRPGQPSAYFNAPHLFYPHGGSIKTEPVTNKWKDVMQRWIADNPRGALGLAGGAGLGSIADPRNYQQ